ncbi:UDP-N-acetylmuramate dehydrogenase [Austwickia chelonae]|uniref:UDP-N-acetylenolpyruvoylglucosamine reductase n=1 Tax=Austwickia chelonae NBRC 105200 TaxID=1184607 RepID=K6VRX5_9MICO|nr:UDP-N-acetylmuramate dehydrogenase [Austwickia chelonae]GAB78085.1 UDP-N-acetylenolpyruvoylglucosamine reductase [Austwickia chelonae NBRC 105200]SEV96091.1 UDP-N-acetylmuramate dehydrogenase [Austwickia chelonae]
MDEQANVELAHHTTMRVGGPARRFVSARTTEELVAALQEADCGSERVLLLSGGSNLLIGDDGFDGTVVQILSKGISVEESSADTVLVRVSAGEHWGAFVDLAVVEGWSGVECLAGIPGAVGATPVQNVGAYGQDVSQTIVQVRVWDRETGKVEDLSAQECAFSYRHSRFKHSDRYAVLDVLFKLSRSRLSGPLGYADLAKGLGAERGARLPLAEVRDAVLVQRRMRGMLLDPADHDTWSCGSFFTNPVLSQVEFDGLCEKVTAIEVGATPPPSFPAGEGQIKTSAAWLIDRAGFGKGHGLPGPASLSTKHVLAVTNRGHARADDVLALARQVRDGVREAFGVTLVNEPVMVGVEL